MWQQYKYTNTDGSRPYFVYTPERYRPGTKVPLLVMLHGCTQTAQDFATGTAMNELAEHYGFIVLYPQQTRIHNLGCCWNWYSPHHQVRGRGEPASIAGIIHTLVSTTDLWTIDPQRIYVAGISAGGAMAIILGATYPDLIAAIGVHSGVEYQAAKGLISGWQATRQGGPDPVHQGELAYAAMGEFSRVVPAIVFHGTDDKATVPMNGDLVVQQWMQTNHLASGGAYVARLDEPTRATPGQTSGGYAYLVSSWDLPGEDDEVQAYWKVGGMGHAWSGGNPGGSYADPLGPNASLAMYQFFMAHPFSSTGAEGMDQTTSSVRWSPRHLLAKLRSKWRSRTPVAEREFSRNPS